jgi:hypothetical protein
MPRNDSLSYFFSEKLRLAGKLRAREASALAQLCNSLYRVIPTADLEARVTMLEE